MTWLSIVCGVTLAAELVKSREIASTTVDAHGQFVLLSDCAFALKANNAQSPDQQVDWTSHTADECAQQCATTSNCTHFVMSTSGGCVLKTGTESEAQVKPKSTCGWGWGVSVHFAEEPQEDQETQGKPKTNQTAGFPLHHVNSSTTIKPASNASGSTNSSSYDADSHLNESSGIGNSSIQDSSSSDHQGSLSSVEDKATDQHHKRHDLPGQQPKSENATLTQSAAVSEKSFCGFFLFTLALLNAFVCQ